MRWFALLSITALAACYAIPSEHSIEAVKPDAGDPPGTDAEVENGDAGSELDAGGDERDADTEAMDGGNGDGGGSLDASDGASSSHDGGADAAPSVCGPCQGQTPECNVNTKQCVACLEDDAGACQGKLCSAANTCIECRSDTDCKSPTASVCHVGSGTCVACAEGYDGQCAHIAGKGVCSAGQCVQCTSAKRSVCKTAGGAAAACDNAKHECTQYEVGKTEICGVCVSDAQCRPGSRCVETTYGGQVDAVGWHCMWQPGAEGAPSACEGPSNRPFVGTRQLASIDAPSLVRDTCVLRASSCPAYASFSANCGRYERGSLSVLVINMDDAKIPVGERGATAVPFIRADATACPGPGSRCVVQNAGTGAFRCTMGCGDSSDCKEPFSCLSGPPDSCSVN